MDVTAMAVSEVYKSRLTINLFVCGGLPHPYSTSA